MNCALHLRYLLVILKINLKKLFTYHLLFISIVLFLLSGTTAKAQWTLDVIGTVKKEENKKRMDGATITVKRNGVVWKTLTSPASGKFEVPLEPNAVYLIEFSKANHVTKRIQLDTRNVPPEDAKYGFDFPMEMKLFEKIEGLDVSILNQPVAKVQFDPSTGIMDFDPAYTKSIQKKLEQLKKELEEKLRQQAADKKLKQKDYDAAIALADKAFNANKFKEAKPHYERASKIFTDESYPLFQLGLIEDELAASIALDKKYNSAITSADDAFKAKEWDKAKTKYELASGLKIDEQYPKDKIKEIKTILANDKKATEDYNKAIALADQFLGEKDYSKAKSEYQKATELKSYEDYPKTKLAEIEKLLAENVKKDADYTNAITEADKAFKAKDYVKAKEQYSTASTVKPEEEYPKKKIAEVNQLIENEKKIEEDYNKFITQADGAFSAKDYANAKSNYEQALALKGKESHPKSKIEEINVLLKELADKEAASKKMEADYLAAISNGDKALGLNNYDAAKEAFQTAASIKQEEQYPKEKIKEIENILAEAAKKEAEEKAKNEQYQKLLTDADALLASKEYDNAKGKYQLASDLKSEEQYPKNKMTEIESLLAELAKQAEKEKAREEEYKSVIVEADGLFTGKDYELAKNKYTTASAIKDDEQYPKDKIKEIEAILAEAAKKAADEKAKEAQYQNLITQADAALSKENYDAAKSKYNEALTIKSEEQYPKDKIKQIDGLLADLAVKKAEEEAKEKAEKELNEQYNALIASADNMFGNKDYENSKAKFNEAITLKSTEQYPKGKIKEIDDILAEIARKKAEDEAAAMAGAERDKKYNDLIAMADKAFNDKKYDNALNDYNSALGVKSEEQHPKEKIAEIKTILADLAAKKLEEEAILLSSKLKDEEYNTLITAADNAFSIKNYDKAKTKYNEAIVVKNEKYPQDKINEIDVLLAEIAKRESEDKLAAETERKKREYFQAIIEEADVEFSAKNYDQAKSKYNQALGVIPGEEYPKNKIQEIESIIAKEKGAAAQEALAKKQLEEKYNALISSADNKLSLKNYEPAISKYKEAILLKPTEQYPKTKITDIEAILADLKAKEESIQVTNNAQKQKDAEYNNYIKIADDNLTGKRYQAAISNYKQALGIKPTEQYPQDKITFILQVMEDEATKNKQDEALALAEKEKRKQYNTLIYDADRAFKFKKYTNAKVKYQQALDLYASEKYPKEQLQEIANKLKAENEEAIVVNSTPSNGSRAKINDKKEREIEARIAEMLKNINSDKEIAVQEQRDQNNEQEKILVTASGIKTKDALVDLEEYTAEQLRQKEKGEQFHLDNVSEVEEYEKSKADLEKRKIKDSEFKRQGASDEHVELERNIQKEQKEKAALLQDKVEELYIFVDNVNESNLIIVEKADKRRELNEDELDDIANQHKEDLIEGEKRRKEKEIDLIALQEDLNSQEEIRVSSAVKKTENNQAELDELDRLMTKEKHKKSRNYRLNVDKIIAFKENIENMEKLRLDVADKNRERSHKENLEIERQINEESLKAEREYYNKVDYLADYKTRLADQDIELVEKSNVKTQASKEELLKQKEDIINYQDSKAEHYMEFVAKVDEERRLDSELHSDLVALSLEKRTNAKIKESDFYKGEEQFSVDTELANKYPQGITEEVLEEGKTITIKRVKITGTHADVYKRTFHPWGGVFYTKNGYNITQTIWDLESIEK